MEWQLSRVFEKSVDGYDGYKFTGFMDRYVGNVDYDLETFFTLSISDIYASRRIFNEKVDYYSEIEDPNDVILNRIERAETMRFKMNELITCVESLDGYDV